MARLTGDRGSVVDRSCQLVDVVRISGWGAAAGPPPRDCEPATAAFRYAPRPSTQAVCACPCGKDGADFGADPCAAGKTEFRLLSLAPRPTVGGGDGMWWREQSWRRQWRRSGQACLGIPCNTQPLVYGSRTSSLGLWVDSHRECMHPSPADRLRGRSGRSRGRYRGSLRLLRRRK